MGALRVEVETITPLIARQMLLGNEGNRRLRPGTVSRYARDMADGNWKFNGESLKLNGDGTLYDGQHRLEACVKADTPFTTVVVRGLTEAEKITLDTGVKRMFNDVLKWRGETSTSQLAATVRWCARYEKGMLRDAHWNPSHQELVGWLGQNPSVRDSVAISGAIKLRVPIPGTIVSGVHYETSKIHGEDANEFFRLLREGIGLEDGSPVLALRRWAERLGNRRDKPAVLVYAAVTIKAVNAWRAGRYVSQIGWRPGGAQAEAFPSLTDEA